MIVRGIVLIILVFGAFLFLGLKISESVNLPSIKMFFFALYFMTIFSIFNLCLTIYFFIKLKDKKGRQGRKGLQGIPGDKGVPGNCGQNNELVNNLLKAYFIENKDDLPSDFLCKNKDKLFSKNELEFDIDEVDINDSTKFDNIEIKKINGFTDKKSIENIKDFIAKILENNLIQIELLTESTKIEINNKGDKDVKDLKVYLSKIIKNENKYTLNFIIKDTDNNDTDAYLYKENLNNFVLKITKKI